jgi:receptor protein-tyrosine kinase
MSKIFEALYRHPDQVRGLDVNAIFVGAQEGFAEAPSQPETVEPQLEAVAVPTASQPEGPSSILANVPNIRVHISMDLPLFPFDGTHRRASEQYRVLRTKVLHHPLQPQMITISSSGPGDGKTITSLNLAAAMAVKNDSNLLLIDGDLRQETLSKILDLSGRPGLSDILSGQATIEQSIVRLEEFPRLYVIPAGTASTNPAELLDSARWRQTCALCRTVFKHIIIDVPPVGSVADYELVQAASDGVLLVIRIDHTGRKHCSDTLALIPPEKLLGIVLNGIRASLMWTSHDYYYYTK